jgi:Cu(I)/Ag(I) efflux system membrane fusion protein
MAASPAKAARPNNDNNKHKGRRLYQKNEVVFKLLNTDKVWAVFNVIQGYSSVVKINQTIRISSELDEKDYFNAKVNFVETT